MGYTAAMNTAELDINLIPKGLYCHATDGDLRVCPHWGVGPRVGDGYCHLLGLGDAELESRAGECRLLWSSFRAADTGKTAAELSCVPSVGTLSFHGKECGINGDMEDNEMHSLRLPGRNAMRYYEAGIPLGETPTD